MATTDVLKSKVAAVLDTLDTSESAVADADVVELLKSEISFDEIKASLDIDGIMQNLLAAEVRKVKQASSAARTAVRYMQARLEYANGERTDFDAIQEMGEEFTSLGVDERGKMRRVKDLTIQEIESKLTASATNRDNAMSAYDDALRTISGYFVFMQANGMTTVGQAT